LDKWRKLFTEEHILIFSERNYIKESIMKWACSINKTNMYDIVVAEPCVKGPLGKLRSRSEDNFEVIISCTDVSFVHTE
jgi:hypothetical protein